MSDAQHTEHEEAHEGPIKTPKQLIAAVVASFVVPVVVIIMLANFVDFGGKSGAGSDGMSEEAVAKRLQPIGSIVVKEVLAPGVLRAGEQVYQAQCAACHASGAAGAPKLADAGAWGPRVKTGYDALLTSALKGKAPWRPRVAVNSTTWKSAARWSSWPTRAAPSSTSPRRRPHRPPTPLPRSKPAQRAPHLKPPAGGLFVGRPTSGQPGRGWRTKPKRCGASAAASGSGCQRPCSIARAASSMSWLCTSPKPRSVSR